MYEFLYITHRYTQKCTVHTQTCIYEHRQTSAKAGPLQCKAGLGCPCAALAHRQSAGHRQSALFPAAQCRVPRPGKCRNSYMAANITHFDTHFVSTYPGHIMQRSSKKAAGRSSSPHLGRGRSASLPPSAPAGPSKMDFVLGWVLLIIMLTLHKKGPQHKQHIPEETKRSVHSFPVFFNRGDGAPNQYCFPDDIIFCTGNRDSDKPCCGYLRDGVEPGTQIPAGNLIFNSVILPICILIAASYWRPVQGELGSSLLGFTLSFNLNLLLTEMFKHQVGYPRPNYGSLAALVQYNNTVGGGGYGFWEQELFTNIPSGHTSLTTCAALYLAFFFSAKLQLYSPDHNAKRVFGVFLCYTPVLLALWTGGTRLQDYFHSHAAVGLGFVFGAAGAAFGWNVAALPYLMPIWADDIEKANRK